MRACLGRLRAGTADGRTGARPHGALLSSDRGRSAMIGEFLVVVLDCLLELLTFGAFDAWFERRKQAREAAKTTSYWDRGPEA
jgi:hypothetical protein